MRNPADENPPVSRLQASLWWIRSFQLRGRFPLFEKDLIELAARRRTYTERVVFVGVLAFVCWLIIPWETFSRRSAAELLGTGALCFQTILILQLVGLHIVVPLIACNAFLTEWEGQTFDLLRISKLSHRTIVFEKFLGRLMPVGNFILLSAPLIALSYPLGGIELLDVISAIVLITGVAIWLTAYSLLLSVQTQTLQAAVWQTYVGIVLFGSIFYVFCGIVLFGGLTVTYGLLNISTSFAVAELIMSVAFLLIAWVLAFVMLSMTKNSLDSLGQRGFQCPFRSADANYPIEIPSDWSIAPGPLANSVGDDDVVKAPYLGDVANGIDSFEVFEQVLLPSVLSCLAVVIAINNPAPAWYGWNLGTLMSGIVFISAYAGIIAHERATQRLQILLVTPLSGTEIMRLKLGSACKFIKFWRINSTVWIAGIMLVTFRWQESLLGFIAVWLLPELLKGVLTISDLITRKKSHAQLLTNSVLVVVLTGPWVMRELVLRLGLSRETEMFVIGIVEMANCASPLSLLFPSWNFRTQIDVSDPSSMVSNLDRLGRILLAICGNVALAFLLDWYSVRYADYHLGRVTPNRGWRNWLTADLTQERDQR